MGGKAKNRVNNDCSSDVIVVRELLGAHGGRTPGPLGGGHVEPLVLCFPPTSEKPANKGGGKFSSLRIRGTSSQFTIPESDFRSEFHLFLGSQIVKLLYKAFSQTAAATKLTSTIKARTTVAGIWKSRPKNPISPSDHSLLLI